MAKTEFAALRGTVAVRLAQWLLRMWALRDADGFHQVELLILQLENGGAEADFFVPHLIDLRHTFPLSFNRLKEQLTGSSKPFRRMITLVEAFKQGMYQEGQQDGLHRGELIGALRTLQRVLGLDVEPSERLDAETEDELSRRVADLEPRLPQFRP